MGFVQGYTVWKFHGERDVSVASGGTLVQADHESGMTEDRSGGTSSSGQDVDVDNDFFTLDAFVEHADGCDVDEDGNAALDDPKDMKLFAVATPHRPDLLYGTARWLDNFKEMKQSTKDLIYKDCSKEWMVSFFDL